MTGALVAGLGRALPHRRALLLLHAAGALGIYGLRYLQSRGPRAPPHFARLVYGRFHHALDVLAGWALAVVVVSLVRLGARRGGDERAEAA